MKDGTGLLIAELLFFQEGVCVEKMKKGCAREGAQVLAQRCRARRCGKGLMLSPDQPEHFFRGSHPLQTTEPKKTILCHYAAVKNIYAAIGRK